MLISEKLFSRKRNNSPLFKPQEKDFQSCPSKSNSKQIELTVHTSCYWGLRLTLCYVFGTFKQERLCI